MLVIFDCDGVLVDSERLAAKIFSETLSEIGVELSPEVCFKTFKGKTLRACYHWLEEKFERALPLDFDERVRINTEQGFEKKLQPVAHVQALLGALKKTEHSFCVASNGGHSKMRMSLSICNLIEHFPNRFSAEDVKRGKPAPDLFLYAAGEMGFSSENSLVVEDSTTGVAAAQAAGISVLLYSPRGETTPQAKTIRSLLEVLEYVN